MLRDLVLKNRSYRRFYKDPIDRKTLEELVDLARLSASGGNLQPLKYMLSCDEEKNYLIFPTLSWAGYLREWPGPSKEERPEGYIIILGDTSIIKHFGCDQGIAAQSILLGAVEKGLGGCIIGSIERDGLRKSLNIPERFEILLVIALGSPRERVALEAKKPEDSIKYWRDDKGVHHVPKRKLEDVIIGTETKP